MTDGRAVLLRHTTERNFSDWVFREAERHGWCGFRINRSEAVVAGVHTLRHHDHRDSHGFPDAVFWKKGRRMIYAELKAIGGRLMPDQRRCQADLGATKDPPLVVTWWPTDEDLIREIFRKAA